MKYLFSIILITLSFNISAQNSQGKADDAGRIAICPVVGNIPDMPAAAEKNLAYENGTDYYQKWYGKLW